MENINLVSMKKVAFSDITEDFYVTVDSLRNQLYLYNNNVLFKYALDSLSNVTKIDLKENFSFDNSDLIDLMYHPVLQGVLFSVVDGSFWLFDDCGQFNCIGKVDGPLLTLSWDLNNERVVVLRGDDTILLLSQELYYITETNLYKEKAEFQHVDVGWGKKETQFHGSEGKEAAKLSKYSQMETFKDDDLLATLCWRNDSEYFAVSFIDRYSNYRTVEIWTRECTLHAFCSNIPKLGSAISWCSTTQLLTIPQDDKNIFFLEKNGLQHGEFSYREPNLVVQNLGWNLTSSILFLFLKGPTSSFLQLWTTSNYEWFLKKSISLQHFGSIHSLFWDREKANTLYIVTQKGSFYSYTFEFAVTRSFVGAKSFVYVLDGANIHVTDFAKAIVPPPMCSLKVEKSSKVFSLTVDRNSGAIFSILDRDSTLSIDRFLDGVHENCQSYRLPYQNISKLHHFSCFGENKDKLFFIKFSRKKLSQRCFIFDFQLQKIDEHVLQGDVNWVKQSHVGVVVSTSNGFFHISQDCTTPFQLMCPGLSTFDYFKIEDSEIIVGVMKPNKLMLNSHQLSNECLSYLVHYSHNHWFIHYTTLTNFCYSALVTPDYTDLKTSFRQIESGSTIVSAVQISLILQAPRGNLETIYPIALLINKIKSLLTFYQYGKAFSLARKHNLDLNVLYDHDGNNFDCLKFLQQLPASKVNLFIVQLNNDDCTQGKYLAAYGNEKEVVSSLPSSLQDKNEDKATKVIDIMIDSILHDYSPLAPLFNADFILSLLLCYIKKGLLESALSLVFLYYETGKTKIADDAFDYLSMIVPIDELYKAAFGTYDLNLILMVAKKSQKDPKDYISFLNTLQDHEVRYRKFIIDRHLGRNESALKHLLQCTDLTREEEIVDFVSKNDLFSHALKLVSENVGVEKKIFQLSADHLRKTGHHSEAAILYRKSDQHDLALSSFIASNNWREAIFQFQLSAQSPIEFSRKMKDKLLDDKLFLDAAHFALKFDEDSESAIEILCNGYEWDMASVYMKEYHRRDMEITNFMPALSKNVEEISKIFIDYSQELDDFYQRLYKLETLKKDQDLFLHGDEDGMTFLDSSSSVTGSTVSASGRSTVTNVSSVSTRSRKRKEQRKKWSLKPGSKREKDALIDAIRNIVVSVDNEKEKTKKLLRTLVTFDQVDNVVLIQNLFSELCSKVDKIVDIVWVRNDSIIATNSDNIDDSLKNPPILSTKNWKLKMIEN